MLDRNQKEKLLGKVARLVEEKYFDPDFDIEKWRAEVDSRRQAILDTSSPEEFELAMHELVSKRGSSHTAFFDRNLRPVPPRQSICATVQQCETDDGLRWMLQNVQEGGSAHMAGLRQGDLLLGVNGTDTRPPERLLFRPGSTTKLLVCKGDGTHATVRLDIPTLKSKQPFSTPRPVVFSKLEPNIGYLKVNMFPGIVGIDVAHDIDEAVASFQDCDRLIIDLRGNSGGGIGGLGLMSYLTPDKLPIGYSLSRKRAKKGYRKEDLARFDRIPSRKIALIGLALRYGFIDHSIALYTEGLGPQKFHGRIVMLVNEHSASAGKMVAAFASENGLAKIVGTATPVRLVASKPLKLSDGYFLILPISAYVTWRGRRLEGEGVKPDVHVELSYEALHSGRDDQQETALEIARGL